MASMALRMQMERNVTGPALPPANHGRDYSLVVPASKRLRALSALRMASAPDPYPSATCSPSALRARRDGFVPTPYIRALIQVDGLTFETRNPRPDRDVGDGIL